MTNIAPAEHEVTPKAYRFRREDCDAIVAAGIFDEVDRLELIRGEIFKKLSVGPTHAAVVKRLRENLPVPGVEGAEIQLAEPGLAQ